MLAKSTARDHYPFLITAGKHVAWRRRRAEDGADNGRKPGAWPCVGSGDGAPRSHRRWLRPLLRQTRRPPRRPPSQSLKPSSPHHPRRVQRSLWKFKFAAAPLCLPESLKLDNAVQELARLVVEQKKVPDIIVNNAGTINKNNKIWEVPAEEFDIVIDTNIKGTTNILRHFIPLMIEKKRGIIVNVSSGWGRSAAAQVAPYCASKWAIEGLTKSVARELPPGLAIIALSPGVINTDMLASCFGSSASLYQTPEAWAPKAANMVLNLSVGDNGASLTV